MPFGFADMVVCAQPHQAGLRPLGRLGLDALATSGLHRTLRLAIWAHEAELRSQKCVKPQLHEMLLLE